MNCTDITATFNFSGILGVPSAPTGFVGLWNATFDFDRAYNLTIAIQDGSISQQSFRKRAYNCAAYLSNYTVQLQHGELASTVNVLSVSTGQVLVGRNPNGNLLGNLNGLVGAVGDLLAGAVEYRQIYAGQY